MNFFWGFFSDIPDIKGDLFPNFFTIVAHLLAFSVLLFFAIYFAWKPLKKTLKERNEYIDSKIQNAEKMELEAKNNFLESQKELDLINKKGMEIILDSKLKAQKIYDDNLEKAKNKINLEKQNFEKSIKKREIQFKKESKKYVVDLVVSVSKKFLKNKIDEKADKSIITDLLEKEENETKL
ncbi:ATP synthase F0 subunit B [symbiont of Argiope bruennichi]|uniref:ATP synthase F0 subunit B n=1 Tax=symbiont of Argiope bruennichi TaxID=2810479 RepID=UPI003DA6B3DF